MWKTKAAAPYRAAAFLVVLDDLECAPLGQEDAAEGCSLLVAKENQKTTSDFDALEPRKRGCSPLLTPKRRATPEKTEDSRLFGVKIF